VQQSVDEAFEAARAMPMHLEMLLSDRPDWALPQEEFFRRFVDKVGHPLADHSAVCSKVIVTDSVWCLAGSNLKHSVLGT
jgi:hypothetical protein